MDVAVGQVQTSAKKVAGLQIIIAALTAVVFTGVEGAWAGVSALFGGFIGLAVSLLLRRGVLKANEVAQEDPQRGMIVLYVGAVQRFVMVLALFGVGLGLLDMAPVAIVVGFGCAQLAYVVVMKKSAHPAKRR